MRFTIAVAIIFALSWIPLVGAFHYETALTIALAGVILIPVVCTDKSRPDSGTPNIVQVSLPKTLALAGAFWLAATFVAALVAFIKGEIFCDFWQGLLYQILIALPSNILVALVWRWTKTLSKYSAVSLGIYVCCVALDIGFTFFALYAWPPLVAFGQFFGFFAGSIYDEAIHINQALIAYRLGTLVLCAALAMAQRQSAKVYTRWLLPCLGLFCACANHTWLADTGQITPFGHHKVQHTLWQTVSAPDGTFHVHFIPDSRNQTVLDAQKQQMLYRYSRDYSELEQFFGNRPPAPEGIHIWLYPDRNVKAQFIGAKNTSFARVWLNEIHLVQASPDSTLAKHEMAHLFAAQFGNGPLKVAGGWNIPALGWIEGLAMAAEWPIRQRYDLHAWSAAILENPQTFGTITPHQLIYGFWGMPSRVAYTLAGSYVAYLKAHYGIERVKQLSQTMPGDFEEIIGLTFDEAFSAWKIWLKTYHVHPQAIHTAALVFGSSSIWNKQCARAQAARKAEFYQCLGNMTCPDLQHVRLNICPQNQSLKWPKWPSFKKSFELSVDEMWSLYLTLGPLLRARMPREIMTIANDPHYAVMLPSFFKVFEAYGLGDAKNIDDCTPKTLDLTQNKPLADKLRLYMAHTISIQAKDWSKAAQYLWLERLGDMMWHSDQYAISGMLYAVLKHQYLPETTARRLDIKHQAVMYPHTVASSAVRRWFLAATKEEQMILSSEYAQTPVIAYLDFINAIHQDDFKRARAALMRLLMFSQNHDPATQISAKTWAETLRLMPILANGRY